MKKVLVVLASMFLMSVAMLAQQVSVNYNHSQSFAQYHTYAWGGNKQPTRFRIRSLLKWRCRIPITALQAKGLKNGAGEPKSRLDRHCEWRLEARDILHCLGNARDRRWNGGITPGSKTSKGRSIIDLYNAKGQSLLWRGIAEEHPGQ